MFVYDAAYTLSSFERLLPTVQLGLLCESFENNERMPSLKPRSLSLSASASALLHGR